MCLAVWRKAKMTPLALNGDKFTLDLTQTVPVSGGGTSFADFSVTGTLTVIKTADEAFSITLDLPGFTIPPAGTPSHTYTPSEWTLSGTFPKDSGNGGSSYDHTLNLLGTVTENSGSPTPSVPLPASALGGISLLGLVAAKRMHKALRA